MPEADAVVFPQVLGEAYRQVPAFQASPADPADHVRVWHAVDVGLGDRRVLAFAWRADDRTLQSAANAARLSRLATQRELRETKFLVYQDDPGEGHQASIFKRFYWWEDECTQRLHDKFGVTIVRKSFREFGAAAQSISDHDADQAWGQWNLPTAGLSERAVRSAVKVYLAVRRDLDADPSIRAAGINCLNESHFSDRLPAWPGTCSTKSGD